MKLKSTLFTLILSATSLSALAQEAGDLEAIRATVDHYFEGTREGNRAKLGKAFIESTIHMQFLTQKEGKDVIQTWTHEEVLDDLSSNPDASLKGHILSINIYNPNAAFVTFDFNGEFTDGFQLIKINGKWRIINKTFVHR